MLIVYDKTQTVEKGLAGWLDLRDCCDGNFVRKDWNQGLWELLAPGQKAVVLQTSYSKEVSHFWDLLFMVSDTKESQYDVLRALPGNFRSRQACIAIEGSGFHGQRQRPWRAVSGNLHLSLSVPLDLPADTHQLYWTMLPAVAVMRTVKLLGIEDNCGIKWVNDVLVGNRKLAGVISSLSISGNHIRQGYLGLGLNVAHAPDIGIRTCSLRQLTPTEHISGGRVLQVLLDSLSQLITLFETGRGEQIFQEYRECSLVIGRRVQIMTDPLEGPPEEICRGRVLAINSDLSLILDGQARPIQNGRLFFLK